MAGTQRQQPFTEINITPLTDIFLVLLIIMMVIAPMLDTKGLKLAVPTPGAAQKGNTAQPKVITIHVGANRAYTVNGQSLERGNLGPYISQQAKNAPDGLLIEADGKAPHGAVVAVMDAARKLNIQKIAVTQTP